MGERSSEMEIYESRPAWSEWHLGMIYQGNRRPKYTTIKIPSLSAYYTSSF